MGTEKLTLNCDMGESYGIWTLGADSDVMPWLDMANIACGFHASDPCIMADTIKLALAHNVSIGAHPSYYDIPGFGRRSLNYTEQQITHAVLYQVGALDSLCRLHNSKVDYIKPHGALYNDMMKDPTIFTAIVKAASIYSIPLMILATKNNAFYIDIADQYNVPILFEAFADRTYQDTGFLAARNHPKAVLKNPDDIYYQTMQIAKYSSVTTISGQKLAIQADTICIHGDNDASIAVVRKLKEALTTR
ncbi:UPF0271 protein [Vibrio sp. MACH09]|uniref:5-oxoprolinase subunit PxpA n=1 Tax=Vibrio sp. MACH09 TaxID=3025122 RepID=UPI0027909061|nr:5-oxoprolinase subunit PxpA [Vibrio sp. MACH09]GLO63636.1 UPF0271 protein [Vibrio sp. MACH09]